jgi:hypothetical protein
MGPGFTDLDIRMSLPTWPLCFKRWNRLGEAKCVFVKSKMQSLLSMFHFLRHINLYCRTRCKPMPENAIPCHTIHACSRLY